MTPLRITEREGSVRFTVHVQPRASRTEVAGVHGDALKIRLSAPPVDGAANAALVEFLADTFAIPRRAVRILAGDASRAKLVELDGVTPDAVKRLVS